MAVVPNFDDKSLIDVIRNYPCLYFNLDKNFKNNEMKELCWTQIATELEYPDVELIKRMWKNLRVKFTTRRKERMMAGEQDNNPDDWPLYEVMDKHFGRFIFSRKRQKSQLKGCGKRNVRVELEEIDEDIPEEKNVEMILCDDGPQHLQPNRTSSNPVISDHFSEFGPRVASIEQPPVPTIVPTIKAETSPDILMRCIGFSERLSKLSTQAANEAISKIESVLSEFEVELNLMYFIPCQ